jgi:hypothetical protein
MLAWFRRWRARVIAEKNKCQTCGANNWRKYYSLLGAGYGYDSEFCGHCGTSKE